MRGLVQVLTDNAEKGPDASISGISGIGHIIMGVSMILILVKVKKAAVNKQTVKS